MTIASNQLIYLTTAFIICSQCRLWYITFIWVLFFFVFVFNKQNFKKSILSIALIILTIASIDALFYLIFKAFRYDLCFSFIDSFSRRIYLFNSNNLGILKRGFSVGFVKNVTNSYEIATKHRTIIINFNNLCRVQTLLTSIFFRGKVPHDIKAILSMLGINHILSPSGAHLSLILEALFYITGKKRIGRLLSILACTAYIVIIGPSASILRALIGVYIGVLCKMKNINTHPIDRCIGSIIISGLLFPGYVLTVGFGYSALCSIALSSSIFISKSSLCGRMLFPLMLIMVSLSSFVISLCWFDYINPLSFINSIIINFALLVLICLDILKYMVQAIKIEKITSVLSFMYTTIIYVIKAYAVDAGFTLFFNYIERSLFILLCSMIYMSGMMLC